MQPTSLPENFFAGARVESTGGPIGNDQLGLKHGYGDDHPLRLPHAHLTGVTFQKFVFGRAATATAPESGRTMPREAVFQGVARD